MLSHQKPIYQHGLSTKFAIETNHLSVTPTALFLNIFLLFLFIPKLFSCHSSLFMNLNFLETQQVGLFLLDHSMGDVVGGCEDGLGLLPLPQLAQLDQAAHQSACNVKISWSADRRSRIDFKSLRILALLNKSPLDLLCMSR